MVQTSLQKRAHNLSKVENQLALLNAVDALPFFESKLKEHNHFPLKAAKIDVLQINLGKMCNQVCKHCHVDAGPDRKEIMTLETMQFCLTALENSTISTVDLTGGAPEMNPNFRWFVERLSSLGKKIIVRCNLTILLANKKYNDLPEFFKANKVEVVSSLPYFTAIRTDAQRGKGVFEQSIEALKLLNNVGYGIENNLTLNLVYNPTGTFLPGDQEGLEKEFKTKLFEKYGIRFNHLFAITNLPVSRFLEYLVDNNQYQSYVQDLIDAFNPSSVSNVMCRTMVSVSWDGYLYDCDFNQMLDLKIKSNNHVKDFDCKQHEQRHIIVKKHCFGCTAGAGSSCGGATVS